MADNQIHEAAPKAVENNTGFMSYVHQAWDAAKSAIGMSTPEPEEKLLPLKKFDLSDLVKPEVHGESIRMMNHSELSREISDMFSKCGMNQNSKAALTDAELQKQIDCLGLEAKK